MAQPLRPLLQLTNVVLPGVNPLSVVDLTNANTVVAAASGAAGWRYSEQLFGNTGAGRHNSRASAGRWSSRHPIMLHRWWTWHNSSLTLPGLSAGFAPSGAAERHASWSIYFQEITGLLGLPAASLGCWQPRQTHGLPTFSQPDRSPYDGGVECTELRKRNRPQLLRLCLQLAANGDRFARLLGQQNCFQLTFRPAVPTRCVCSAATTLLRLLLPGGPSHHSWLIVQVFCGHSGVDIVPGTAPRVPGLNRRAYRNHARGARLAPRNTVSSHSQAGSM